MPELTLEEINSKVVYDAETGVFRNQHGIPVGHLDKDGYVNFLLKGKIRKAHRVAWFISTGKWPVNEIDHINGIRNDNRISNLREANRSQNTFARRWLAGEAGFRGVVRRRNKFEARICHNKKSTYLGIYDTAEEAYVVYQAAAKQIYGEFIGV